MTTTRRAGWIDATTGPAMPTDPAPTTAAAAPAGSAPVVGTDVAPVSLRCPQGLYALEQALGSPALAMRVASQWTNWGELAAASLVEVARATGGRALRLPPICPSLPALPTGVAVMCRFDARFPAAAGDLPDLPGVLFGSGTLPTGPTVTIAGTQHPSATGYRLARQAASLAVARSITVVGVLDGGCGEAAVDQALDDGGRVVAVVPYGLARLFATNRRLATQVLAGGGALVSTVEPVVPRSAATQLAATRLAVALAPATFLAEAGLSSHQGLAAASGAMEAQRYLIVPDHTDPRTVELSGLGSMALSRNDSLSELADTPRLRARQAAGQNPADAVVANTADLAAAINYGSGATSKPPPQRDLSGWICLE